MLNIFKQKFSKKLIRTSLQLKDKKNIEENLKYNKYFVPGESEWHNNIYSYNKNYIKSLPSIDNKVSELIKSYFNYYMSEQDTQDKKSFNAQLKLKRLSVNKIFVSNVQVKHTNSKVFVILHTYNEEERYLKNTLKIDPNFKIKEGKMGLIEIYLKKINLIKSKVLSISKYVEQKNILFNRGDSDTVIQNKSQIYKSFVDHLLDKYLNKEMLNINYLQKLYLNRSKFMHSNLLYLNNIISMLYGKQVEFNIVNLKYLHLNSDLLLESVALKLNNRQNKLIRTLKTCLSMVELPNYNRYTINYNMKSDYKGSQDTLQQFLTRRIFVNDNYKIINFIRHKTINGIRLEASGRLSKRFTASRSVFKFNYIGSLKNIRSSYTGLPSSVVRGHMKSNIQYTKISSKTRNGSFGLKGWVSSN